MAELVAGPGRTMTEVSRDAMPEEARSRPPAVFVGAVSGLAALIAGLLVAAAILGVSVWGGADRNSDREAVLTAARQGIVALMTITPGSVNTDVARLLDATTGEFRADFVGQKDIFVDVVKKGKVASSGEIRAAGVESITETSARVLVAAHATVSNSQSPKGEARDYRMAVDLKRVGDNWLISNVEFVP